ncbi:U2 small nuclear ribonucleoprotein auxiliary factor 35 kDa subunit-related protein 2-like isoform X2 [Leptidea sinapis]|uniref:U2 small nuclear ribonucleoprotein auxiliary factor 35 kDa subunit-related protein 2-like isoform X2 n=1 Tax=Leptidea sinapis TaxID=189913 RepID=UPI0021C4029E|nr:U2 small nuclear ribonucleoprotein auxiliary factor 35 kDa subunit-related protein 2-like isoform X2 [Leptidea sinapis]XP_050675529.1 U2 small nuclear ribonucleoprotein auxiliary factor 35 kDa subunit-related protein 2-like isoform X2 [Leptidea sinapis]
MGRHRDWRKIAKRERRRKIRKHNAKNRDCWPSPSCNEYKQWIIDQELLEQQEIEQIEEDNRRENEKWLQAELITITRIKKFEAERQRNLQKQLVAEAKMREEWEEEKLRREKESQRLKQIEEENLARQAKFLNSLEEFLNGNLSEPPEGLSTYRETKPNMELCPFFVKTSCCRFGDQCSRNHQYPAISNILLATNFYVHFGLENANFNEYDTDVMLEYEESETSRHYKDFFYDVLPEFQKHGKITQFKVR